MTGPTLQIVGRVRSDVRDRAAMPHGGIPAVVEIFSPFEPALAAIEQNSHIIVLAWLDGAERDCLQLRGRGAAPDAPLRGVFGLRSADRPNPIGLTATRLLRRDGAQLWVERLDFVDGTPVIDVKRYSPGWDAIFAARTQRDQAFPAYWPRDEVLRDLAQEAAHFHGERCPATALAARMVYHVGETWRVGAKNAALRAVLGADPCLRDAVQALTGATLGSGRLLLTEGSVWRFRWHDRRLAFIPRRQAGDVDALLALPLAALFDVEESAPA
jgi:tRNA-Thr(GGU) m(6)t(6)A37 methyltransferase TsaA